MVAKGPGANFRFRPTMVIAWVVGDAAQLDRIFGGDANRSVMTALGHVWTAPVWQEVLR